MPLFLMRFVVLDGCGRNLKIMITLLACLYVFLLLLLLLLY